METCCVETYKTVNNYLIINLEMIGHGREKERDVKR